MRFLKGFHCRYTNPVILSIFVLSPVCLPYVIPREIFLRTQITVETFGQILYFRIEETGVHQNPRV
jgi:hypothetical protein